MKKTELMNNLTRSFHKVGFKMKKHSPEILIVAGVVGTVTSAVMACKATTKLNTILETSKESIDAIHEGVEKGEIKGQEYTPEDGKKDLTLVYTQTGLKIAKLYAPSVALGILSLGAIVTSNNILRTRYAASVAAYTALDTSFKGYRKRVVERFGEELDKELRYNIKAKEVEETIIDEKGNEKVVKKTVEVYDPNTLSDYARFFDDGCLGWTKDPELNFLFLKQQQNYANELLKARGHLYLNEVYDMLGIPRSQAGQIVGWVYDEKNPVGDNFVDFGLFNTNNPNARDFVNGHERVFIIDPNVDGNILELMS